MKSELAIRLVEIVKEEFPEIAINIYAKNNWFVESEDKWIAIESDITKLVPTKIAFTDLYKDSSMEIHKILLIGKKENIQDLYAYLAFIKLKGITFYLSKENYLEIVAAKVSKEMAVRELAKYYQVVPQEILTIGDQFNDVPMLKLAGIGVAMGNAPVGVKQAANFVTASNDDDGVARALEDYVL